MLNLHSGIQELGHTRIEVAKRKALLSNAAVCKVGDLKHTISTQITLSGKHVQTYGFFYAVFC